MASAREGIEGPGDPAYQPARHESGASGPSAGDNISRPFALIVGVVYLAVGLVGFAVTGFTGLTTDGGDKLLVFDLNVFHNFVHLAIGLGFIAISQLRDVTITQGVLIGAGLVYVVAALLGFINELQILSIDSGLAADNFLHLFSGLAAVAVGLAGARQSGGRVQTA